MAAPKDVQAPNPKATVIVAQVFISCLMALLMTGIFTAIPMQFQPGWVGAWMTRWLTAWPIAFVLSLGVGPISFALSTRVLMVARRG